jgi:transposase InsO family protein
MIAFIDNHREAHGVEPICKVLPIAPSTYHDHVAKRIDPSRLSARAKRDEALKDEVRRVFEANFRVYGVRKVWRQLQREDFDVARCTVARLMRAMGLEGIIRGKTVRTTVSDKAAPCPLDHVNRQFHAPAPNMLWLSDFTYVATWTGFVYVAFVIDAYARRIVGWRVSRTAHAGFVLDALEQALHERRPAHRTGAWCIIRTEVLNTSAFDTPSASPKRASSRPSAASATLTTTRSPKRSTVSTRPRSSIDADHGARSRPSSSPRWNGSTGSTIAGCWSPSAASRQPKPRSATTPCWSSQHWPRDSNETASDKPGTVHWL